MSRVLQTPYALSALRPTTTHPSVNWSLASNYLLPMLLILLVNATALRGSFVSPFQEAWLPYPVEETGG